MTTANLVMAGLTIFAIGLEPSPASTNLSSPADLVTYASVCDLKAYAARPKAEPQRVEITAGAYYDFEHGYFLSSHACLDRFDGTGVIAIGLPPEAKEQDFPELMKLSSQEWLATIVGKRAYCRCIGKLTVDDGIARFVVERATVWASND